ncbi:MAG: hypothetical protein JWO13_3265 [Acidobacteriales bacterium]|nr:hypothetical protein [Terriglobales bacterium]
MRYNAVGVHIQLCQKTGFAETEIRGARTSHLIRYSRVTIYAVKKILQLGLILSLALSTVSFAQVQAQTKGKRLILRDGSYQIATKWEVQGDRVRYYSSERFMWEELPISLVDWPATKKYEADREAGRTAEQNELRLEAEADRKAEEAKSPTVAPGLRLPEQGGVFILDSFQSHPQLVELVQNGSEINKQMGKNILRSVINPLPSGPKQTVELKGTHARIQSHTGTPTIYVNVNFSPDDESQTTDASRAPNKPSDLPAIQRFKIVRLDTKKDSRVVSNLKVALTGRINEQQNVVNAVAESLSADWTKLTPATPLSPGEYAIVEMLGPKQMNLYVWDFGVDPSAPANASAWKPAAPTHTETGTSQSPALEGRPKK